MKYKKIPKCVTYYNTDDGKVMFADYKMTSNNEVTFDENQIKFKDNKISLLYITDETFVLLPSLLEFIGDINSIDLSLKDLSDKNVKDLIELLKVNENITSIDLCCTNLSYKNVKDLIELLKVNENITSIDLSHNNISDKDAEAILEELKDNNRTITSINFGTKMSNATQLAAKEFGDNNKQYQSEKKYQIEYVNSVMNLEEVKDTINHPSAILLKQKLLPKLFSMTSKELSALYNKHDIQDKTLETYKQILIKKTGDKESICNIFDPYEKLTCNLIDLLIAVNDSKFDLKQAGEFYSSLINSPLDNMLNLFKKYDINNIPELINEFDAPRYLSLKNSVKEINLMLKTLESVDPSISDIFSDIAIFNLQFGEDVFEWQEYHETTSVVNDGGMEGIGGKYCTISTEEEQTPATGESSNENTDHFTN